MPSESRPRARSAASPTAKSPAAKPASAKPAANKALTNKAAAAKPAARRAQAAPPADKFAQRRSELAQATLQTLADLGYARTSLREIAQNSEYSHGVLHYYFTDKLDLIGCSVREYKTRCATRYDDVVAQSRDVDELVAGFLQRLGETLRNDASVHSLWYDLRSQALFEQFLRADVVEIDLLLQDMVWRVVARYAELMRREPATTPEAAYALLDGLFQRALLRHVSGDAAAAQELQRQVQALMPMLLA
ncbi:TetR/AcrR family transcriptional regulator [Lysobacter enzymogenes]|uniref:TetR family transcriptional regulator n=1 Tax=Lysobacter enzymogenes TaxID=69 RepID=A0AAU9AK50_LYSEN|nr:TetR/AcrR family transcriptional regulator [Lysobacter enzymogenes]BAV98282.1 TetR family transcriptional regulator [Lysobacter enzymogenes]